MRSQSTTSSTSPSPRAPGAPGAERAEWLDVARGITIMLVVLVHADGMLEAVGERSMAVHLGVLALFPLRMPLFFLVSGILAASMLARPARRVLTDRTGNFMWLWAVWTALGYGIIGGLIFPALGLYGPHGFFDPRLNPIAHLISSNSWAWFLYALALFFTTALLIRRLPAVAQIAIAIALALPGMFELGSAIGVGVIDRFYFFPYFLAGALASQAVRREGPKLASWPVLALLLGAWVAATVIAHKIDLLETIPGRFVLSFVAVPSALCFSVLVAKYRLSTPLKVVGTSTLIIYLLHPYLLRVLAEVPRPDLVPTALWALLVVLVATLLCLVAQPLLSRVPGLLALPGRTPRRTVAAAG